MPWVYNLGNQSLVGLARIARILASTSLMGHQSDIFTCTLKCRCTILRIIINFSTYNSTRLEWRNLIIKF